MTDLQYSCVFCDDVRQEIGGKHSFIGVYSNDLIITIPDGEKLVPSLSKFFIVCFLKNLRGKEKHAIEIQQSGVEKKTIPLDEQMAETDGKIVLVFSFQNFPIPEQGDISVYLISGKSRIKLDSLNLVVNTVTEEG